MTEKYYNKRTEWQKKNMEWSIETEQKKNKKIPREKYYINVMNL